jgi:hypothetical protein
MKAKIYPYKADLNNPLSILRLENLENYNK